MLKNSNIIKLAALLLGLFLLMPLAGCGEGAVEEELPEDFEEAELEEGEEVIQEGYVTITTESVYVAGEYISDKELYDAAIEDGYLVIYTAQVTDHEQALVDTFQQRFPEITVEVLRLAGGRLHERIMTEYEVGQLEADIVVQSDIGFLDLYVNEGMIEEHTPPAADQFITKRDGYWYPITSSPMIIQYNTELVSEEEAPKDWMDLTDPKWKGRLGVIMVAGGSNWTDVYTQHQLYGTDLWEGMAANEPSIFTGGSGITTALISGEIEVGVLGVMSSYPRKVHMEAPLEFVFPPSGYGLYTAVIGIFNGAENMNAAKFFTNWYLSVDGQSRISAIRGTYSERDDVSSPMGMPPLEDTNFIVPDFEEFTDLEFRDNLTLIWNEIFGN